MIFAGGRGALIHDLWRLYWRLIVQLPIPQWGQVTLATATPIAVGAGAAGVAGLTRRRRGGRGIRLGAPGDVSWQSDDTTREAERKSTHGASGHEAYVRVPCGRDHDDPELDLELEYGTLMLDGTPLEVGEVEDEPLCWSRNGRYFAATVRDPEVIETAHGPLVRTRVIVIDAESRTLVGGSERPGLYYAARFRRAISGGLSELGAVLTGWFGSGR